MQQTVQSFGWPLVWSLLLQGNLLGCKQVANDYWHEPTIPVHFPDWPGQHPIASNAQVELGRWLFYDNRLSVDGSRSCGICHEQVKAFSDGLSRGLGIDNAMLSLNSPALFNIAWRSELTWYQQFEDVESHMFTPLFSTDPMEMGMTESLLEGRLEDSSMYSELFNLAFPDDVKPIQLENVVDSIAAFTRTIISGNSRYDQWMQGLVELTISEQYGRDLFMSERLGCAKCHGGIFFDEPDARMLDDGLRHGYFNTGLYNIDGAGAYPISSQGLIELTGDPNDMGAFRVPTLRNLRSTYPWMHDGSEIDLRNIIRNYASGGRVVHTGANAGDGRLNPHKSDIVQSFEISEEEIEFVLDFLWTLNDDAVLTDERFASPFCIEQRGQVLNSPCEPQIQFP